MVSRHFLDRLAGDAGFGGVERGLESLDDDDVGGFLEFVGRVADERGAGQRGVIPVATAREFDDDRVAVLELAIGPGQVGCPVWSPDGISGTIEG